MAATFIASHVDFSGRPFLLLILVMGLGNVWRDPLSWADFLKMAAIMVPFLPRSRLM